MGGKVEVPGGGLAEGDRVAIVSAQPVEPIQLPADQEDELVAALEDTRLSVSTSTVRTVRRR